MSVTILECLQNAKINLIDNGEIPFAKAIGKSQLHNAVTLLEKGYPLDLEIGPILGAYPEIDDAPEYEQALHGGKE